MALRSSHAEKTAFVVIVRSHCATAWPSSRQALGGAELSLNSLKMGAIVKIISALRTGEARPLRAQNNRMTYRLGRDRSGSCVLSVATDVRLAADAPVVVVVLCAARSTQRRGRTSSFSRRGYRRWRSCTFRWCPPPEGCGECRRHEEEEGAMVKAEFEG
jgi:hypothetical protein